jgi:hypothetical protein
MNFFLNILAKLGFRDRKNKKKYLLKAFTLGEVLLVIAIIGLLAGVISTGSLQAMSKARDSNRLQNIQQISQSLFLYYTFYRSFPTSTDNDCLFFGVNWDAGNKTLGETEDFIKPLIDTGFLNIIPREWKGSIIHGRTCVYRYAKVQNPCGCVGTYAILYASCESPYCPVGERPSCCTNKDYPDDTGDGTGKNDAYDIAIFLKEK